MIITQMQDTTEGPGDIGEKNERAIQQIRE